jgi:hypothetical protein
MYMQMWTATVTIYDAAIYAIIRIQIAPLYVIFRVCILLRNMF